MKTIRLFGSRSLTLILGAAFGVSLSFAPPAFAQAFNGAAVIVNPDGKVTYLGTLRGSAINDAGQVLGSSATKEFDQFGNQISHAFITGANGMGMRDLGTLGGASGATGINDAGQVVGSSVTKELSPFAYPVIHAFITGPGGKGMTDLGTLGGAGSHAFDINDAGQVVGYSDTKELFSGGQQRWHAFITGPDGRGMTDLGTLGGILSTATGINDAGQVAGYSDTKVYPVFRAFITGPNGKGMTDLGNLGGDDDSSFAYDINDSGQVAGGSGTAADDSWHAFITGPDGKGMTDLGTLGGKYSQASGINDAGQVVGDSHTKEGGPYEFPVTTHGFITGPNGAGMIDINSYADLPDGYHLRDVKGINNLGQVIGTIYNTPPVIPEPASYALMLAGLGLVGFMARRKRPAANTVSRS